MPPVSVTWQAVNAAAELPIEITSPAASATLFENEDVIAPFLLITVVTSIRWLLRRTLVGNINSQRQSFFRVAANRSTAARIA